MTIMTMWVKNKKEKKRKKRNEKNMNEEEEISLNIAYTIIK